MFQEKVLIRDKPVVAPRIHRQRDRNGHRRAILKVLERAAEDDNFIAQLTHQGSEALGDYDLTWEEEAALLSGDIRWIEAHVGKLNARQRTWPQCRLQQEIW